MYSQIIPVKLIKKLEFLEYWRIIFFLLMEYKLIFWILLNLRYQITRNGLKVKNVKKEAAGEYTCQIITEDNIKTTYITLRVDDQPPMPMLTLVC